MASCFHGYYQMADQPAKITLRTHECRNAQRTSQGSILRSGTTLILSSFAFQGGPGLVSMHVRRDYNTRRCLNHGVL